MRAISRRRLLGIAVSLFVLIAAAGALPAASEAASQKGPSNCPEMTNPGGGLDWEPSDDPGPDPTSNKVELTTLGTTWPIVRVGIDQDNKMVVAKNARDVAWLDQGPLPGRTKNIVLAGHINWGGQDGSFKHIGELKKRDDIYLVVKGKKQHFKVTFNCAFPRDTTYANQIMGKTNVTSLTLISCGGKWNSSAGTHDERLVVRAEKFPSEKSSSSSSPPHKPDPPKKPRPTPTPTPTPESLLQRLLPPYLP